MTTPLLRLFLVGFVLSWSYVSAMELTLPQKLPQHPRFFFTKQKEAELKSQMKTDPVLDKLVEELIKKADRLKNEPPTKYELSEGRQLLLGQARRSLERTTALAFAYRMTDKKEYADAAITEMLAVSRFKDWNPSHYLESRSKLH